MIKRCSRVSVDEKIREHLFCAARLVTVYGLTVNNHGDLDRKIGWNVDMKQKRKKYREDLEREPFLERAAERASIPKDLAFNSCCLTAMGQNEIVIENYRGILEYTPQRLLVLTRHCLVEVQGKRLEIAYYGKEEMKITGRIECISYKKQ